MISVVIAGSRRTPPEIAYETLGGFLVALPPDSCVFMRRGISTPPGGFEAAVEAMCDGRPWGQKWHRQIRWFVPKLTEGLRGRASVYVRDRQMFETTEDHPAAELLLAFITPQDVDAEGDGGTLHLVYAALDHRTPTYCYLVEKGTLTLWGSDDPENIWDSRVP